MSRGWGGTTHYSLMTDNSPPARFPIEIIPGKWTTKRNPVFNFSTTDKESGIDRYEMKIVPLSVEIVSEETGSQEGFFWKFPVLSFPAIWKWAIMM